jgi:hypothetical protein
MTDVRGLDVEEIGMRNKSRSSAKEATTIRKAAAAAEGTYFDIHFQTPDESELYSYFEPSDFTIVKLELHDDRKWWPDIPEEFAWGWRQTENSKRVHLNPDAPVKYEGTGEDIHLFILLDSSYIVE